MPNPNESPDITAVDFDADPIVYYRPGQVIAVGENARDWVLNRDGSEEVAILRGGREGAGAQGSRPPEPAFLLMIAGDPEEAVAAAPEEHHVQLNHVFFAHAVGPNSDPCCEDNPHGIFQSALTPYRASPYRASSSNETSAVKAAAEDLTGGGVGVPLAGNDRPNVQVWIIDTGIGDGDVPTPLDGFIDGDATDNPDKEPPPGVDPVAGHGTFIAGIIEQLTPGCDIWISDVISPNGDLSESDVVDEIDNLLAKNSSKDLSRTLLNLSFGGGMHSAQTNAVGQSIAAAQAAGVVVVASAGNEASCRPFYPAFFPYVVAVGALDSVGAPAEFTNRGGWVEACALGVDIVSTFFHTPQGLKPAFEGWAIWSGTSFATPVVVAAIAKEMATNGTTAKAARIEVLKGIDTVPCLGVRVDAGGFSAKLEATSATP